MYYLSLPPNRYLFHGAELNIGGGSSDDESSDDSDSGGDMLDNSMEESYEQIDDVSTKELESKPTPDESSTNKPVAEHLASHVNVNNSQQTNQPVAKDFKKPMEELRTAHGNNAESFPLDEPAAAKLTLENSVMENTSKADKPKVILPDSVLKSSPMHNDINLESSQPNKLEPALEKSILIGDAVSKQNSKHDQLLEKPVKGYGEITPILG